MNPKKSISRHIVIKLSTVKDKEILSKTGKVTCLKGTPMRLSADFSVKSCMLEGSG